MDLSDVEDSLVDLSQHISLAKRTTPHSGKRRSYCVDAKLEALNILDQSGIEEAAARSGISKKLISDSLKDKNRFASIKDSRHRKRLQGGSRKYYGLEEKLYMW